MSGTKQHSALTQTDLHVPFMTNAGSPEGVVTANVGAFCFDESNKLLYYKNSGESNTGWILWDIQQQNVYGVSWDQVNDVYTRFGPEITSVQNLMRRCILDDNGNVVYYLDSSDSTKKADGSAADVSGADGQVMVEIPKFYYAYSYSSGVHTWKISLFPFEGGQIHPAFYKNGEWVDYRYIGAYEATLKDVSASRITNGLWLEAGSVTFTAATSTISRTAESHPFTNLEVGDKIVVSGTTSNNGTFTVATTGDQSITVTEALTDETAAAAVIQTEKDWANDLLCSISGKAPINYGTRANFRAAAANRGTGWRQLDFYLASAVQLLYLTEYQSFYSQSEIGNGLTDWASATWSAWNKYNPIEKTGNSNSNGNSTANNSGGDGATGSYMSYRGIENFFGHIWKWVDGFNINNNVPYFSNNDAHFADDTNTNYIDPGITLINANGYQKTLETIKDGFLPSSVGGASNTFITDYYYQNTGWLVALLGGSASSGGAAGAFCWALHYASSNLSRTIGGRLCF